MFFSVGRGLGLIGGCVVICLAHRWLVKHLFQLGCPRSLKLGSITGSWSLGWVIGLRDGRGWQWLFREEVHATVWSQVHRDVKFELYSE
ncbi:MAG: hypothetical protein AAF541_02390 [Pseudomonadota bacterium]